MEKNANSIVPIQHTKLVGDYTLASVNTFTSLFLSKSYVAISGVVLEHIMPTQELTSVEKIFYLLVNSLAIVNKQHSGKRVASCSALSWAKKMGCSRRHIFAMQQSLADKGYLLVDKSVNASNQDKRNLLTPTVPSDVFAQLLNAPSKLGKGGKRSEASKDKYTELVCSDLSADLRLDYLDKTKLFIPVNYQMLLALASDKNITSQQKLLWLDFYSICFKNYQATSSFSMVTSYAELTKRHGLSKATISRAFANLESNGFISKSRYFAKKEQNIEDRKDKSLWMVSVSLPDYIALNTPKINSKTVAVNTPDVAFRSPHINRYSIANKKDNKSNLVAQGAASVSLDQLKDKVVEEEEVIEEVLTLDVSEEGVIEDDSTEDLLEITHNETVSSANYQAKRRIKNNLQKKYAKSRKKFNICSEILRYKLRELPKSKADKARRFAYSIHSKSLAKGYAASLSKQELARQIIFHAATWKPTKVSNISQEKQIDIALTAAWKAIVEGSWTAPLGWIRAEILQSEYESYRDKYILSGVMSHEVKVLEGELNRLTGSFYHLVTEIEQDAEKDRESKANCNDVTISDKTPESTSTVASNAETIDNIASIEGLPKLEDIIKYTSDITTIETKLKEAKTDALKASEYYLEEIDLEAERSNNYAIDISQVPEEQRQVSLITNEDTGDQYLRTASGKEYKFEVKMLEINDLGEHVFTMKHMPFAVSRAGAILDGERAILLE